MDYSLCQTITAVADSYYCVNKELAGKIYEKLAERVGGFPGIWYAVGIFAADLHTLLTPKWDTGDREFIDDTEECTTMFAQLALENEKFPTVQQVLDAMYLAENKDASIFDVMVECVVRVKYKGIVAQNAKEAARKGSDKAIENGHELFPSRTFPIGDAEYVEFAEDVRDTLVDVQGDTDFSNSQWFDSQCEPIHPTLKERKDVE